MKKILWSWIIALACGLVPLTAEAGTIVYYHNDLLGSPAVATDSSGNVIWRESYRPYGERLTNDPASSANDVWFTSRRQDAASGLVYMGARYYDPVIGRFLSVDPKPFSESSVHSFNRYTYANNNPYKFVDLDGREPGTLYQRGWAIPPPDFSKDEPGLGNFDHEILTAMAGFGIARLAIGGEAAVGGGEAASGESASYRILDGVRRAKAADLAGKPTIAAEVEGEGGAVTEIPISNLRSPREIIDTAGSGAKRWSNVVEGTEAGKMPPILVRPGSAGVPIKDVIVNPPIP